MTRPSLALRITFNALILAVPVLVCPASGQGLTTEAGNLLARARENQYGGDRTVSVLCVRDSYLRGEDTLSGWMEFHDARGERRLSLRGAGVAFEWWSRSFGEDQWWKDDDTERLRRIAPHSLKKPALAASPLSYEDLVRFPLGYFDRFTACKRLQETDSTYELTLTLSPLVSSRYSTADVSIGKRPLLLRRVIFSAPGKPSKSVGFSDYKLEHGKYALTDLSFEGGDGLVSLRFLFTPRGDAPAQDKTWAPDGGVPAVRPRDPKLEPRDVEDMTE